MEYPTINHVNHDLKLMDKILTECRLSASNMMDELPSICADIEERWKVYIKLCNMDMLEVDNWENSYLDILDDNLCLYDDFYIDRYQTVTYEELWNDLNNEYCKDKFAHISKEKLDAWREKVMSSKKAGFKNDW